ncbi:TPA: type II toxin-antitoxin system HicB family antitoxin [Enterococcus faecium]|uniref:type II toxin-antitoxin system HicB family antitoxin n=1 Tax=Enterococcus faecium TaxID=1352 RepID=UPI00349FDEA9|nr:type II toxin-antitoxin system HicB family antitoxin [Enterococcus faecium]HCI0301543.1 type II toxin-antitoxin system HicB family antitoxin [Enterococcus faecium]HCI0313358.1 type II toxin-antitoxin system HicB family antitoxin [Enterococcus faecium]HCI0319157.1 type II toxin-antitoxin system HicB family antitoxin [Enterococcus faecium]HCI0330920.1 type II toxin-antitoxin system HicB family antitoxin [Enterococcus faecium]
MLSEPLAKTYPAIFSPEEGGGYFIEFPDVQGAYTGINEDDISYGIAMAQEVLGMVLADYIEHEDLLPEPTPINKISVEDDSFTTLIRVDVAKYLKDTELVKKTLTIPQWADKLGKRAGINFSVLLTESIADKADNLLRSGRNN